MSELPSNWEKAALSEVAEVILGQSPPSSTYNDVGDGLPFFQGKTEFGDLFPVARKYCSEPKKIAEEGDVLISVRAPVGPTNLASTKSCIGRGLAAIRPYGASPSRYFLYYLRSIESALARKGTGTTFKAISGKVIRGIDVPLPPLPEQHRIVARLEELFSHLDAGVAALHQAKAQLQRYRQSVLTAAVTGQLTQNWRKQHPNTEPAEKLLERILQQRREQWSRREKYKEPESSSLSRLQGIPSGWAQASMGQLGFVIGGFTKNNKRNSYAKKLPYLRVANVYSDELRLDGVKEIGVALSELEKLLLRKGDLLIVEGNGSKDQIGRLAIWDGSIEPCVHQNHLIKVRLVELELGRFVVAWMLSPSGRPHIERVASSTSGLYTLSVGKVANLPVPLPPLAEQHQIVAEVEVRTAAIDHLEAEVDRQTARSNRLRLSTLSLAFCGKL